MVNMLNVPNENPKFAQNNFDNKIILKDIPKKLRDAMDSVSSAFVKFKNPQTIIEGWEETSFSKAEKEKSQGKSPEETITLQKTSYKPPVENAFTHLSDSEVELREYTSRTTIGPLDILTPRGVILLVRTGLRDISAQERQQRYFSPENVYRRRPAKQYQASRLK